MTAFALNHVKKVFRVASASNAVSNRSCVRSKPVGYVGTRRIAAAALKIASGGGRGGVWCFVKDCVI